MGTDSDWYENQETIKYKIINELFANKGLNV